MIEAGGEKVIAKVIVDVPLMQTDKPYSIRFHQNLKIWLRRECEFMFPLVKGIASFKGIVVDVVEEADTSEELKAIGGIRLHSSLKSRAVLVGRSIAKKCLFLQNNNFKSHASLTS